MTAHDTGETTMFFSSERTTHDAETFKYQLQDLTHELRVTQEVIAQEIGVSQPTVSQWMNPRNDNHFPAFLLAKLPSPLRYAAVKWILRDTDIAVARRVPLVERVTGDLVEQVINIGAIEGDMIRLMRVAPLKCRAHVEKLRLICDRMDAEINFIEKKDRT